jgi:hypothetical protein
MLIRGIAISSLLLFGSKKSRRYCRRLADRLSIGLCAFAFLLAVAAPAVAQAQQATPPETALQIDNVINTWAQTLVQQGRVIEQQAARIKELEDKYEPKKPEAKK